MWWSGAVITTGSESRRIISWVGKDKTGTVNIQPEINGCAQTYGYSDVGDVFGIPPSFNEGFKLKQRDSALEMSRQKGSTLNWENKVLYKADNENGQSCIFEKAHMVKHTHQTS